MKNIVKCIFEILTILYWFILHPILALIDHLTNSVVILFNCVKNNNDFLTEMINRTLIYHKSVYDIYAILKEANDEQESE